MSKNTYNIIDVVRRHLLILLLSMFFFNPYTLAAENETMHDRPLRSKADLLSQLLRIKNSGPMTKSRKIGLGLNHLISRKTITEIPTTVLSISDTSNANKKTRIILETSEGLDLDPNEIKRYGCCVLKQRGHLAVVEIQPDNIEAMVNDIEDIKYARLPFKFFPMAETSEGVGLTGAVNYHNAGYTGSGVRVALIDAGFKGLSDAQENGDLPYSVKTHDFPSEGIESVDNKYYHGTACAEIVHDMAPDAELHLLKVSDEVDIYDALDYCMDNDIDIISLSVATFGTGPGDGTGYLDESFDEVRDAGILTVAAAGNYATYYDDYGGHWQGEFFDLNSDDIHEFIPNDPDSFYNVLAAVPAWDDDGNPEQNEVTIVMRWNDDWPYADIDYDIFLFDYIFNEDTQAYELGDLVGSSNETQDRSWQSSYPLEIIVHDLPNTAPDDIHYYALFVSRKDVETEKTELEIYIGGTGIFVPFINLDGKEYHSAIHTQSSSITEPADAESVLAVGAIDYMDWETGPQESFSSQGPTNAWSGSSARFKPDICGPDNITTSTFGKDSFPGTSASAPHVAGAAALILSKYPHLSPDELQAYIESKAIDMGEPGKDNIYGWGRMDMTFPIDASVPSVGGGGGGGCFIATAAFGSPMEPQVKVLRDLRDNILINNPLGKALVAFYNRYSPPAAAFISRHDMLRAMVRWGLLPTVWISWLILRFGLSEVITVLILLIALSSIPLASVIKK